MDAGKLIINFAPAGLLASRETTPHAPLTPVALARDVAEARQCGASIVHLHARDADGRPTYTKDAFRAAIGTVREVDPSLIVCVSTSGRLWPEYEQRAECLDLDGDCRPDMASLTLGSVNFLRDTGVNTPAVIQRLAERMKERGIKPELEAFDMGMIHYARHLQAEGLLEPPFYFNLILGNIAGAQPRLGHLGAMVQDLPPDSVWAAGGIGPCQIAVNLMAMAAGGGVRVGLEDNVWESARRQRLATNADLLRRIAEAARLLDREIATPGEVRAILGLNR